MVWESGLFVYRTGRPPLGLRVVRMMLSAIPRREGRTAFLGKRHSLEAFFRYLRSGSQSFTLTSAAHILPPPPPP